MLALLSARPWLGKSQPRAVHAVQRRAEGVRLARQLLQGSVDAVTGGLKFLQRALQFAGLLPIGGGCLGVPGLGETLRRLRQWPHPGTAIRRPWWRRRRLVRQGACVLWIVVGVNAETDPACARRRFRQPALRRGRACLFSLASVCSAAFDFGHVA